MFPYKSYDISRPTKGATGNKRTYQELSESCYIFVQPQDPALTAQDPSFSKTYRGFAPINADLQPEDEFTYYTKKLRVAGTQLFDFGTHQHMELQLEEVN